MANFFLILIFLLSKITKEEEIEKFEMAKASACLALSKYEIKKRNNQSKQEIFNGLINCYYLINEEQLITLVDLVKNDDHDFKNTIFEGLVNGKNFIKNFPDQNDRKEKIIKFNKVFNEIKSIQEKNMKNKNDQKENSNSVGGIKFLFLKGILNTLKKCSRFFFSKNKNKSDKNKKM